MNNEIVNDIIQRIRSKDQQQDNQQQKGVGDGVVGNQQWVNKEKKQDQKKKKQKKRMLPYQLNKYSKIDDRTLHLLPFLPGRKRESNLKLKREWGRWKMEIEYKESWNIFDAETLLLMIKEYLLNGYAEDVINSKRDDNISVNVATIKINVKEFLKKRGIKNKKINHRKVIFDSFNRIADAKIYLIDKDKDELVVTRYIYEIKSDQEFNHITIYANLNLIREIILSGVLINLDRLITIRGNNEKLLYIYIEGTKKVIKKRNKEIFIYRERYSLEELEYALKLDLTNLNESKKIAVIKRTFKNLYEYGFIKREYRWNKESKVFEIKYSDNLRLLNKKIA